MSIVSRQTALMARLQLVTHTACTTVWSAALLLCANEELASKQSANCSAVEACLRVLPVMRSFTITLHAGMRLFTWAGSMSHTLRPSRLLSRPQVKAASHCIACYLKPCVTQPCAHQLVSGLCPGYCREQRAVWVARAMGPITRR